MALEEERFRATSRPNLLTVLVAATGALLVGIQFGAFERVKRSILEGEPLAPGGTGAVQAISRALGTLLPIDAGLIALLGSIVIAAVVLEVRSSRLSRDFTTALEDRRSTILMLGAFAFAGARFYLAPGELAFGDATVHVSRIHETALSFAAGERPDWSFHSYAGYPLLQFYSPLFFWIGGALERLVGDPHDAAKLLLFAVHWASAFPLYGWARAIGVPRLGAFVAAVAYVLTFQHTHLVLWAGALPAAPLFLLVPLQLFAIEKVLRNEGMRWIWILGLSTGGAILSHHGHAAFALQLAAIYTGVRWVGGGRWRPELPRVLRIGIAVLGGLLFGSELLWSIFREGSWTYPPDGAPLLHPQLSLGYVRRMISWRNQWSGFTGAYVGDSVLLLGAVGLAASLFRAGHHRVKVRLRAVIFMFAVSFLCAEQAGGRVGNWMLPPLCVLAGVGVGSLSGWRRLPFDSRRLAFALLTLIVLDVGTTTIQSNFSTGRRALTDDLEAVAARIEPERAIPAYRNDAGATEFYDFVETAGDVPSFPLGGFPQGAPRSLNTQLALVDQLNESVDSLEPLDLDLLRLWNVSTLVVRRSRLVAPEIEGAVPDSAPSRFGNVPFARVASSPVLFAPEVRTVPNSEFTRLQEEEMQLEPERRRLRPKYREAMVRWTREMSIDRDRGRAAFFPLYPGAELPTVDEVVKATATPPLLVPSDSAAGSSLSTDDDSGLASRPDGQIDLADLPSITVTAYAVSQRRARIAYEAQEAGFLRLAFSWYPSLEVQLDGEVATPARGLLGGIVLATPEGPHVVELIPTRSRARDRAFWLGPLLGLALMGVASVGARGRRTGSPDEAQR